MIGYRLEGITEDYYKFFYIPADESVNALTQTINDSFSKSQTELDKRALEAWTFITTQKTAKNQVKKMIDYIGATL